ncbi:MAG: WD40 repeat domain-containing protein [Acidimicrobiia bacterium]
MPVDAETAVTLDLPDAVEVVAWHPAGRLLAAGDLSGTVAVVDADTGRAALAVPDGHGPVSALAWAPSGCCLAVGTVNGRIHLATPQGVRALDAPGGITALAWSPSGHVLAVGAGPTAHAVTAQGDRIGSLGPLAGTVQDLAWCAGPGPLAVAAGTAVLWCTPGASCEAVDRWAAKAQVRCLSPAPTGDARLAAGDLGGTVRVLDAGTDDEVTVSGFTRRIARLAWDPAGTRLAVPDEHAVTVWHLDGAQLARDEPTWLTWHDDDVTDLAFGQVGGSTWLASVDALGCLRAGRAEPAGPALALRIGRSSRCLRWRPGLPQVAVGDVDGEVRLVALSR